MKCLSVSQPFADLIISGKKTIELRKWNTKFRGEILIHSPQKIRTLDYARLNIPQRESPIVGAIIGKVTLYDVIVYESVAQIKRDQKSHYANKKFFEKIKYGFMLKNPKPFAAPIPYKGQLGLFDANLVDTSSNDIILGDIIDQEYRYRLVGHH